MNKSKEQHRAELAIQAIGLVKTFGDQRAVDDVNLEVPKGTVYGFLGPNGAGKTTTIRMLSTLLKPDAGNVRIFGHDLLKEADEIRAKISLTGQFASVDEDITGMENLILVARLLGYSRNQARERASELLKAYGLEEAGNLRVKYYSGGMRRRIDIAASTVVPPDLLFLDEPTTGLDPRSRRQVWDIVRMLVNSGTTIMLTTQYLEEADQLADKIGIIERGKIIAEGTSGELKASIGAGILHVRMLDPKQRPKAKQLLEEKLKATIHLSSDQTALYVRTADTERVIHALRELSKADINITDFSLGQPSLDEVFLSLTGRVAHDPSAGEEVQTSI